MHEDRIFLITRPDCRSTAYEVSTIMIDKVFRLFAVASIRCANLRPADTSYFAAYYAGVCLPSAL